MVMKRFLFIVVAILGAGGASACEKPSADDCRRAINNMLQLMHTDNTAKDSDIESEVRRCKGGSSKEAVACAIKAQSQEELKACNFWGAKSAK
jgi:hypothetical protein